MVALRAHVPESRRQFVTAYTTSSESSWCASMFQLRASVPHGSLDLNIILYFKDHEVVSSSKRSLRDHSPARRKTVGDSTSSFSRPNRYNRSTTLARVHKDFVLLFFPSLLLGNRRLLPVPLSTWPLLHGTRGSARGVRRGEVPQQH